MASDTWIEHLGCDVVELANNRTAFSCCQHYLGCHVLADGLNLNLDILNQKVELVLDELQAVHLVLPVLQRCHSEAP